MAEEMDEEPIVHAMVRALRTRPAEWLTFRDLSTLIANREMDEEVVGAIAEYRKDIFAITNDRKLKLRESIVEQTAHLDLDNWTVPERRIPDGRRELRDAVARALRVENGCCYCSFSDPEIFDDIFAERVPDGALILSCCWKTICRVRGQELNSVPPDIWEELCRRWAIIRPRENPRDF